VTQLGTGTLSRGGHANRYHHRHGETARAVRQCRITRSIPNQFVNASLLVDTHKHVADGAECRAANRLDPAVLFMWSAADNTVAVRTVQLGAATADRTEITSRACTAGERVVVDGADRLEVHGANVTVPGPAPAGGTAPRHEAAPPA
jgi:hypothetical protein